MKHLLLLFISLTVFLVSCGDDEDSPTSPSANQSEPLMPLAVGNEWEYEIIETNRDLFDTIHMKILITEQKQVAYKDQEITAYKKMQTIGDDESQNWSFELDSKLYTCLSLEDIDNSISEPYSISLEDAATMGTITLREIEHNISVDSLDIMGERMACIKLEQVNEEDVMSSCYKLGLGLVKADYRSLKFDFKRVTTLKSYTLN